MPAEEKTGTRDARAALRRLEPPSTTQTDRYYERLRARINGWLARHAGPRHEVYRRVLFLVPDVFTLVFRLAQDRRIGFTDRLKLWGLALYILSPVDVNLDFILPFGPLDDLALALLVLDSLLTHTPATVLREHWPGEDDVLDHLRTATKALRAVKNLAWRRRRR